MVLFVVTKLGTFTALLLATSLLDLILPLVGSVISSATTARVTYRFLDNMLQDIKDDAVLLHEHVMKINADHRMLKLTATLTVVLNTITYNPYQTYNILIWFIHVLL